MPVCPGKDDSSCCCTGMWEAKPEDLEQNEAVFKVSDLYCTVPLTKHETSCSFHCSEISCTFVGCSFGAVCLTVGFLFPVVDGPLKQR